MRRLKALAVSEGLSGVRVIVTGCGFKPVKVVLKGSGGLPVHDSIIVDGEECKLNIGAATAAVLARQGAVVHMVSRSADKLAKLAESFRKELGCELEYSAVDLLDESAVNAFVGSLSRGLPLHWVQSVGLGAGSYSLKDDNPYLPLEDIPLELLEAESLTVLRSTHLLMRAFLPLFRQQGGARVVIVTSMSAVRGYGFGGTHCASKGALDRYANSAMLALYGENILVTTIRPGIVDTGLYDSLAVRGAVVSIAKEFGCEWHPESLPGIPPSSVGQAVALSLSLPAHIVSLNLVAQGQFPNEGS